MNEQSESPSRVSPTAAATATTDGVTLIAAERKRQIESHGFDAMRDDGYTREELAAAATHYLLTEWDYAQDGDKYWPDDWDRRWDQKDADDRITQLVKAGALIAAEIDRLQRASTPESSHGR